jgi:DNA-binding XRE family transcriptional regulator
LWGASRSPLQRCGKNRHQIQRFRLETIPGRQRAALEYFYTSALTYFLAARQLDKGDSMSKPKTLSEFIERHGAAKLARALGLTEGSVSRWKHGKSFPRRKTALILVADFGLTMKIIYGEK